MNAIKNKEVVCIDLGLIDYKKAWDFQEKLFRETVDIKINNRKLLDSEQRPTPNYLIFCQHPHVYTLGKSGKEENLLLDDEGLKSKGATYYKINRGGDITYHGPGQLVAYPILDLENFFTDIHKYLRYLEEAVILTLKEYEIDAGRIAGLTGVWIDYDALPNPRKICAMGVKTSRWITMHGLALNVNSDISYFNHIVPCGIEDKAVTSMHLELNREIAINKISENLKNQMVKLFGMELVKTERTF